MHNHNMASRSPFRLPRIPVALACIIFVIAGLMEGWALPGRSASPAPAQGQEAFDFVPPSSPTRLPPESLIAMSSPGGLMLAPTATAVPKPSPGPRWVRTMAETVLLPVGGLPKKEETLVPEGSYLRVVREDGRRLLVYYEGERGGKDAGEAWVDGAKVAHAAAPSWVLTVRATTLRATSSPDVSVPAWTALEVLEESGVALKVFYLTDGASGDPTDGWISTADLGAAGRTLAATQMGARWLSGPQVVALRSGDGLWLRVPYRSQLDGSPAESANCGPSSVAMALGFFGRDVPTAELRALAERLQGTPSPEAGVAIEYLPRMLERYGLKGLDLYAGRAFRRWTLEDVRAHLASGHPVIPELRYRLMPGRGKFAGADDHYVVISGMQGDDFIYSDSVDDNGPGPGRLISSDALMRAWGGSSFPFAGFAVSGP